MEQIIAALITGIVTLIVALLAVRPGLKSLEANLKERINELGHRADRLSGEHGRLSDDHKSISNTLSFLKEARIRDDARNEALAARNFDVDQTIRQLMALHQSIEERDRQIAELKAENARLNVLIAERSFGRGSERDEEQEL